MENDIRVVADACRSMIFSSDRRGSAPTCPGCDAFNTRRRKGWTAVDHSVYTQGGFEWDRAKAVGNREKHGVCFGEAATVFCDVLGLDTEAPNHSAVEKRRLRLGMSSSGRLLMVASTLRGNPDEEVTRIISARIASPRERARHHFQADRFLGHS